MRRISSLFAFAMLVFVAGSAAAEKVVFQGSFSMRFTNLGQASGTGTGTGVATVNGSSGFEAHLNQLQIPPSFATVNAIVPVTDPVVQAGGIVSVRLTSDRPGPRTAASGVAGYFAPISGAVQNTSLGLSTMARTMPIYGMARICLIAPGCASGSFDLTMPQPNSTTILAAMGVGGTLTINGAGTPRVSVEGAPWTIKTASVTDRTDFGAIQTVSTAG